MIILVELLGEVVAIVGDQCRREGLGGLRNLLRIGVYYLDQTDFLRRKFHSLLERGFHTLGGSLSEDGLDARVSILDEWSGIAIEVDGFLRVKEHCLLRIDLYDKVLESAKTNHMVESALLLFSHIGELARLLGCGLGLFIHLLDKVIRIHNGTLPRFHLTLREFHHSI